MKLLLLGDLSPTEMTNPLFEQQKVDALFTDTRTLFNDNDLCFLNLECALTHSCQSIEKFGPALKATPNTAKVLKELGVSCCGISNNHVFDYGIQGVRETVQSLQEAEIAYTGFGANQQDARTDFVVERDGERLCVIAVCEHEYSYALEDRAGCRAYDPYDTLADIRKAKERYDTVVVMYHGGKEFCAYPSPRLHKACRAMAENGADVVLCQHSHCVGCYEQYHNCHILYGQGNFHFIKPGMPEFWYNSLAVQVDTQSGAISFTPLVCEGHKVSLAKGKERESIEREFAERNAELASGMWREGWHRFCEKNRQDYTQVIGEAFCPEAKEEANKRFGHYLDCEAHTDVWRELFPTANHTNER